jgi:hypothetical protein
MEEQPIMPTEPTTKVKKTADKKAYMREYKKKEYQENKEEMKEKNRAYYYKYKFKVTTEDHTTYGTYLPSVVKIRKELEYLKENNPDLIKELLKSYM